MLENLEGRLVPQNPVGKVCVKQGFESCMLYAKLYIPSAINILYKCWTFSVVRQIGLSKHKQNFMEFHLKHPTFEDVFHGQTGYEIS